jgi:hypothetical protein
MGPSNMGRIMDHLLVLVDYYSIILMNYKNAQVLLTINLEAAHKPRFVKGTVKGVEKLVRVFDPEFEPNADCYQIMLLSEEFVNNAISFEGRVAAKLSFAFNNWKKMTPKDRLEYSIGELVNAMQGHSFVYEVILDDEEQ